MRICLIANNGKFLLDCIMKSLKSNISYITIWVFTIVLFVLYSLGIIASISCVSDTCNGLEMILTIIFSLPCLTILSLTHFGYLHNLDFFRKYKNVTVVQSFIFVISNWYLFFVWNDQIKNVYFAFEPLQIVAYFWICFAVFLPFFANLIVLKFPNKIYFYLTFVLQALTILGIIFATSVSSTKRNEYIAFNYKRNQQICNEEKIKLQNYLETAKFQDKYNKYTFGLEVFKSTLCENEYSNIGSTDPFKTSVFNLSIIAFDKNNIQVLNVADTLKVGVGGETNSSSQTIVNLEKQLDHFKENYELSQDENYEIMSYSTIFGIPANNINYLNFGCAKFKTDPQKGLWYPQIGEKYIYQYKRLKNEQWFKCVPE
jgi:hypothetical protein